MVFGIDNKVSLIPAMHFMYVCVKMFELVPKLLSIVIVVIWDVTEVW